MTRDMIDELGCETIISKTGLPLQVGRGWRIERTNSWHARGFHELQVCTERITRVIEAFIALANAIIIIRLLIRTAWHTHRWDDRPLNCPWPAPLLAQSLMLPYEEDVGGGPVRSGGYKDLLFLNTIGRPEHVATPEAIRG